jgi:ubiquinone/menaquinone biosynthesis C-methylase UbiE
MKMGESKSREHNMDNISFLEMQEVVVSDFQAEGFILDIGGGGEGVIGQLKGDQVIAIDPIKNELEEAADGPLKIIMDATDLQFLDGSFQTATSFFTLMYINAQDQQKVFDEVFRVLEANGKLLIWEIDLPTRREEKEDMVAFYLRAILPETVIQTGYGAKWPEKRKDLNHYKGLAEKAGFKVEEEKISERTFYLELVKA